MGYAIDQGVPEFAPFDFICDGKRIQLKAKDADGTDLYRDKKNWKTSIRQNSSWPENQGTVQRTKFPYNVSDFDELWVVFCEKNQQHEAEDVNS